MIPSKYGFERILFANTSTIISLILGGISFAYTFGILNQRVTTVESITKTNSEIIANTPVIQNELKNIDRRLESIENKLDKRK